MEHEKIDGEDFYKLMNGEPLDDKTGVPVQNENDAASAVSEDTAEVIGDNVDNSNNETNQ